MKTLRLLNLHCNRTDDNDDNSHKLKETFLTVENGLFHIFGPKLMMNGSDWNVNADIQFNGQAIMSFFDGDLVRNLSTTESFRNYIVKENNIIMTDQKTLILLLIMQIMFSLMR